MTVGSRIKELRERRGFTQNRLAEWAGVSQTHLRRVELGEADITVGHLALICDTLGVSLGEFFSDPKEFRYLRTVIVTAAVYRGLSSCLRLL